MTRIIAAAVFCLVALVGCASADGQETSASNEAPVEATEVTAVKSYKFEPEAISVSAGTTVNWTNEDDFPHNVHLIDADETHDLPIGESVDITFDEPGEFLYECSIHPQQMRGKIVVTG